MSSINTQGYEVYNTKYVHRMVAEKALGRELRGKELVHHIDGNRSNNCNKNLVICPNDAYHLLIHARQRIVDLGGHPDRHAYCSYHKCLHKVSAFSTRSDTWNKLHNMCRAATNKYRKQTGLNRDKFDWKARLHQQYRRVFSGYTKRNICLISPKEDVNDSPH